MAEETIFRKKSIDRISSPEELDTYLKVTTPSVWLILIGIIVVLIGIIAWGSFGEIKTFASAGCVVDENDTYCYIKDEYRQKIEPGDEIMVSNSDEKIMVLAIDSNVVSIPDDYLYLQGLVGVNSQDFVFELLCSSNLPSGYYGGKIEVESISPLKFIFN